MINYVYDVRHHAIKADDWEQADKLVAMLVAAIERDEPVELALGTDHLPMPASVAIFLLDGLLRLCGDDGISMVLLAEKERLGASQTASILRRSALTSLFPKYGLKPLTSTVPLFYDQQDILKAFGPPVNERGGLAPG